jgi:hypothetical protein
VRTRELILLPSFPVWWDGRGEKRMSFIALMLILKADMFIGIFLDPDFPFILPFPHFFISFIFVSMFAFMQYGHFIYFVERNGA